MAEAIKLLPIGLAQAEPLPDADQAPAGAADGLDRAGAADGAGAEDGPARPGAAGRARVRLATWLIWTWPAAGGRD